MTALVSGVISPCAPPQSQLGDVPLDVFEACLRLLQQQVGATLRLAYDHLRLVLRRPFHLVGEPLRRLERVAQVLLANAMVGEERLRANQVLAQSVDLAERVLVVAGRFRQERHDFRRVEAAHHFLEALVAEVERRDLHHASGR